MRAFPVLALVGSLVASTAVAQPLSRSVNVDYQRDIPSRNLAGLAARADGRLVSGPFLHELKGPALGSMVWSLAALPDGRWLVGTGPQGRLQVATLDLEKRTYSLSTYLDLPLSHIHALAVLADGSVLAAGSPKGALCLIRDGKLIAQANLPAEIVHDILVSGSTVYVSTGAPARVFTVDVTAFGQTGLPAAGAPAPKLEQQGIKPFAEVKDRHLRRLALTSEGLIGGSSPRGHIYRFGAKGGAGIILMENKDSEVTSLLPLENGDVLATLTVAAPETEARIGGAGAGPGTPTPVPNGAPAAGSNTAPAAPRPTPTPFDRFAGRGLLLRLPAKGSPELLAQRNGTAFYGMARADDLVLVAGGEQGDLFAFDLEARMPMTLAGSPSAQLSRIALLPAGQGHLVLRNNPTGLSLLRDDTTLARTAESKRLDLGALATLGAWRPARIRDVDTEKTKVEVRLSRTSDESEGWTPWIKLGFREDGWYLPGLVARHIMFRLEFPAPQRPWLDKTEVFLLPENRRPGLSDFRYLPPNLEIRPPAESSSTPTTTVGALLAPEKPETKPRSPINGAQTYVSPGMQAAVWNPIDADGDNLVASLSIRPLSAKEWIPVAVDRREGFVQFSTSTLAEGEYESLVTVRETAPRPTSEQLTFTLQTDSLTVDRSGPEILRQSVAREGGDWVVTVEARDTWTPLDRLEVLFNQGVEDQVAQPVDGLRDSRREVFIFRIQASRVAESTSVEIAVFDQVGNVTRVRLSLAP